MQRLSPLGIAAQGRNEIGQQHMMQRDMQHDMQPDLETPHGHVFLGEGHERNERRTWVVIALCGAMMMV